MSETSTDEGGNELRKAMLDRAQAVYRSMMTLGPHAGRDRSKRRTRREEFLGGALEAAFIEGFELAAGEDSAAG